MSNRTIWMIAVTAIVAVGMVFGALAVTINLSQLQAQERTTTVKAQAHDAGESAQVPRLMTSNESTTQFSIDVVFGDGQRTTLLLNLDRESAANVATGSRCSEGPEIVPDSVERESASTETRLCATHRGVQSPVGRIAA